jgi:cytidine deaminase
MQQVFMQNVNIKVSLITAVLVAITARELAIPTGVCRGFLQIFQGNVNKLFRAGENSTLLKYFPLHYSSKEFRLLECDAVWLL